MSKKKYPPYHLYPGLVDSHAHLLYMKEKGVDLGELFEKLSQGQFSYLLDAGVKETDFDERIALSGLFENIYYSVGIHPENAEGNLLERLSTLKSHCNQEKVVAIGEIGLDYYWKDTPPILQKEFFTGLLQLACDEILPVIIHNREADGDCLDILSSFNLPRAGVMHCFSSDKAFARKVLDRGFYLSFAGNVTYKSALNIREAARYAPSDRILIETDAPYLSPQERRGRTNHPGQLGYTLDFLCALRGQGKEELLEHIKGNFENLFLS